MCEGSRTFYPDYRQLGIDGCSAWNPFGATDNIKNWITDTCYICMKVSKKIFCFRKGAQDSLSPLNPCFVKPEKATLGSADQE